MITEAEIEAVARAMCRAEGRNPDDPTYVSMFMPDARAAIAALPPTLIALADRAARCNDSNDAIWARDLDNAAMAFANRNAP